MVVFMWMANKKTHKPIIANMLQINTQKNNLSFSLSDNSLLGCL